MKRRIVLIVSAVVLALLGTVVVYSYIDGADSRALNGVQAVSVLVASKPIPAGTPWSTVKKDYVSTQSYPESSVPSTSLKSTTSPVAESNVTTFPLQAGQVLSSDMFGTAAAASTGSLHITGDRQALTIALPPKADVGGYVAPDSDVAVYSIVKVQRTPGSGEPLGTDPLVSKMLIERVRVLAVSQTPIATLTGPGSTSPSAESLMVTLEVTQQQAERLILAQKVSDLYLTLLTATSKTSETSPGVFSGGIFNPTLLFK